MWKPSLRPAALILVFMWVLCPAASEAQTLRLGFFSSPRTLNPVLALTKTGGYIGDLLFNALYGIEMAGPDTYVIRPELAADEPRPDTNDPRAYFVELRDDVHWHGGESPVRAEDVICTFRSIRANRSCSALTARVSIIEDIEYIDDRRMRVVFKTQVGPNEAKNALNFKVFPFRAVRPRQVLPGEIVSALNDTDYLMTTNQPQNLSFRPIGTGPYMLSEAYYPDQSDPLTLVRNEDYFDGAPEIEEIQIQFYYPSGQNALGDVAAGNRHLWINPPPSLRPAIMQSNFYDREHSGDFLEIVFLGYNWRVFGDSPEQRKALYDFIQEQVNIDGLMVSMYRGSADQGQVSTLVRRVHGPVSAYHVDRYELQPRFPEPPADRFQSLRSMNGRRLRLLHKSFDNDQRGICDAVRRAFRDTEAGSETGIEVSLEQRQGINDYFRAVQEGDFDLLLFRFRSSNRLARHFQSAWQEGATFNVTDFSSADVNDLIRSLSGMPPESRNEISTCRRICSEIVMEVPGSWLWSYRDKVYVHRDLSIHEREVVNFLRIFGNISEWRFRDES